MKKIYLVMVILCALMVGAIFYAYNCASQHKCPYCGGELSYQTQVIKSRTTYFRYVCEKSPYHIVDVNMKF